MLRQHHGSSSQLVSMSRFTALPRSARTEVPGLLREHGINIMTAKARGLMVVSRIASLHTWRASCSCLRLAKDRSYSVAMPSLWGHRQKDSCLVRHMLRGQRHQRPHGGFSPKARFDTGDSLTSLNVGRLDQILVSAISRKSITCGAQPGDCAR